METKRQENHTGTALLVGAAVGYLVGRRRGRIKTEKQAAKVERKLTSQIRDLEQVVAEKEQRIRTVAREAYINSRSARGVASESLHSRRAPNTEVTANVPSVERESSRAVLPSSELLGAVTLKAVESLPTRTASETLVTEAVPAVETRKVSASEQPAKQSVETMSREELMEKAANVSVGATNLRRVYETHLVTEQGLRRLMVAHERGENVQQMLRQELVEKESSFERDPRMRNRGAVGALAAGAVVALPTTSAAGDKTARITGDTQSATSTDPAQKPKSQDDSSQVLGIVTAATLVVIIAVLLYILFTTR
jgi:hypothetical protein